MGEEEKGEMTLLEAARSICTAALDAVDPGWLVRTNVVRDGDGLRVVGETFDLSSFENVRLIAFGKAAAGMAEALAEILGDRLSDGLVITPAPANPQDGSQPDLAPAPAATKGSPGVKTEYLEAAHPVPDDRSVEAARRALALAEKAGAKDLVFVCISGGGSSLLCLPAEGLALKDKTVLTRDLLRAGASIRELNVVRKHLSGIKGGGLAKAAFPATLVSLLISDVNGDDLETIASGPTYWDSSTFADAREILERYGLWQKAPASVRARIEAGERGEAPETLKSDDPVFENAHALVIGNNLTALRGARRRAEGLGFEPFILTSTDEGEACKAAHDYAAFIAGLACSMSTAPRPVCLLAGGELTVEVRGKGKGGRNTEFVLASLLEFAEEEVASAVSPGLEWLVLSMGTDGVDGPTDAAGAWADGATLDRAKLLGLDAEKHLDENDSYSFFEKTGNLVITGPTGTNVCDVRVFLIRPAE
jgi:glycerate 2-kinase